MDLGAIFRTAHLKLKPRSPVPRIEVEFFPFVGLSHTARLRDNVLKIRVSDLFVDAPRDVYESLAWILLSKLYRRKVDSTHHRTYRLFTLTEGIQEKTRQARSIRGRRHAVRAHGRRIKLGYVLEAGGTQLGSEMLPVDARRARQSDPGCRRAADGRHTDPSLG